MTKRMILQQQNNGEDESAARELSEAQARGRLLGFSLPPSSIHSISHQEPNIAGSQVTGELKNGDCGCELTAPSSNLPHLYHP
jgi:hypothetical protein